MSADDRGDRLHELYQLMEDLSDEHGATDAVLEKREEGAAIVLVFALPEPEDDV